MNNFLKTWASPIAIIAGILFYKILDPLSFLIPALLFSMIFVTYCGLSLQDIKFSRMHIVLIISQILMSLLCFFIIIPFNSLTAEAIFICVITPTAISATVIAAMIGGNTASLALYTLFGNLVTAVLLPFLLPSLGITEDLPFLQAFWFILKQLFLMLIFPLILALLLFRFFPKAYQTIRDRQSISFYIWIASFAIVIARSVRFFLAHGGKNIPAVILIIGGSLVVFIIQFWIGRRIGSIYGERITGGQALGHKNTVLAIWMAQAYLQPLASIAPTAYILWQAAFNGYQVWQYNRQHPES
ncbi:bile acid:sodium symporter family protein [Thermodesulfobacteriota bacterium]